MMMPAPEQEWTETILNAVATPVIIAGAIDRVVIFINRAASKFVGKQVIGSTVRQAFGIESGYRVTDSEGRPLEDDEGPLMRASRGEPVGPLEVLWHTPTDVFAFVCYAERVPPTTGAPSTVVLSLFDVTAMRKLQRDLIAAEKARDEFVHLAAHELRTPLTGLRLRVESAMRRYTDLPGVAAVASAVDRMSRRVEQLIDVADMREHLVSLDPERVDLLEIIRDAVDMMEPQAQWARSDLVVEPTPPIFGCWDVTRLTQIVASLLSNAVKFGRGKPVEVAARDGKDDASISVIDHGPGIPEADREVIFERFQRRVSAAHFGGLGLDLWVARELLRQMNGSIAVDQTPGGGATFTIRLPKNALHN
jgi:signal transduction histidine kinase